MTIEEFRKEKDDIVNRMVKKKKEEGGQISIEEYETALRNLSNFLFEQYKNVEFVFNVKLLNEPGTILQTEDTFTFCRIGDGPYIISPTIDGETIDYNSLIEALKKEEAFKDGNIIILPPNMMIMKAEPVIV